MRGFFVAPGSSPAGPVPHSRTLILGILVQSCLVASRSNRQGGRGFHLSRKTHGRWAGIQQISLIGDQGEIWRERFAGNLTVMKLDQTSMDRSDVGTKTALLNLLACCQPSVISATSTVGARETIRLNARRKLEGVGCGLGMHLVELHGARFRAGRTGSDSFCGGEHIAVSARSETGNQNELLWRKRDHQVKPALRRANQPRSKWHGCRGNSV
jgi:hypothetical protein